MGVLEGLAPVPLGRSGLLARRVGFGTLPLGGVYGPIDEIAAVDLVQRVVDLGVNLIDTSDIYADGHVEEVLGKALVGRRDDVLVCTRFGAQGPGRGRPDTVRAALEASLRRLGTDCVDVYYLNQIDPLVPIEETVGAMGELVSAGKVRAIGLSEVTAETLRRAHAEFPIAALQQEYSLLSREIELGVLPEARALGIALVAYSPLGRGLLTGAYRSASDLARDDIRRARYPRFSGRALTRNLRAMRPLVRMATDLGATPAALAFGWVLAAHNTVPIPGTRSLAHFEQLLDAARLPQDIEVTRKLSSEFPVGVARGNRYAGSYQRRLDEAP